VRIAIELDRHVAERSRRSYHIVDEARLNGGYNRLLFMHAETDRAANEIAHWRMLAAAEIEGTWGWSTPAGQVRARRRADLVINAAGLSAGRTVLEIGCGTGLFTTQFAATGARIVAVDLSPELLAMAVARQLPADRVRFEQRRFESLQPAEPALRSWAPDGFDAIIGSSVLHHLDIAEAIETCKRLLARGGRVALAEPNLLNPQVWLERRFRSWFPYVSRDETAIVRWELQRQLERAGFSEVVITPFDWLHPATPQPLMGVVGGVGKVLEHVPVLREFAGSVLIAATWRPR
jgi:2-polyprenyl-3-methyl-5-hydroxy-6-metoxy-1,4-benzoquinol methylase